MNLNDYVLIYQFAVFVLMIPFSFKMLEGLNIDALFKRTALWQKQSFYLIMTVVIAYLFSEAVVMMLRVFIR
jgi:uncharacterized membrane protein YwzB